MGVSDCRAITAIAVATGSGDAVAGLAIDFEASPDGTQNIPVIITGATNTKGSIGNGAFAASVHDALITLSFVRMLVDAQANSPLTTSITFDAWIWCEP